VPSHSISQAVAYEPLARSYQSSQKIKVCYLLGSLSNAGTERQALELIEGLNSEQFAVYLILFEDDKLGRIPKQVQKCCVLRVPQKSSKWINGLASWPHAIGKIYARCKEWSPDIVHAFLAGPSILGVLPARLAGVPVFIGSRRSLVTDYRRGRSFASFADTLALKLAHLNLANSAAVSKEMISLGSCPPAKCKAIYNGVDTDRFKPGLSRAWRGAMGWDDTHVVFAMVANFYRYKRHIDFARAAALISKKHPEARFVMAGGDYGSKTDVVNEVAELGLGDKIQILDSVSTPEYIFAAIDILVSTSETEGLSNVLLEAMACGKPVIATQTGGNPEIVFDGETGFLVPIGSPEALAQSAGKLINDPTLRHKFGAQARKRIVDEFSLYTMVHSHEELYRQMTFESQQKTA
jgi:L-malate glycosyltransferase